MSVGAIANSMKSPQISKGKPTEAPLISGKTIKSAAVRSAIAFKAHFNYKVQHCPIKYPLWQTQVSEINPNTPIAFTTAKVGQTPAKVRTVANGVTICTLSVRQAVGITSQPYNGWYRTDACGTTGYIDDPSLEFPPQLFP